MSQAFGVSCYKAGGGYACDGTEHPGWWHPDDWNDVEVALNADVIVVDEDGDSIDSLGGPGHLVDSRGVYEDGMTYIFTLDRLMIQGERPDPVSEEEERAILASIAEAFQRQATDG